MIHSFESHIFQLKLTWRHFPVWPEAEQRLCLEAKSEDSKEMDKQQQDGHSVLGGIWAEGGIHSHGEEKCSQMAWEGPFSSITTLPGSLGRGYGYRGRNSSMWGAPAKAGTYKGLSCALRYRDILQPHTPHVSGTGPWGHDELFLLSYRGKKWRQTGWPRISEHGPNLDPDVPLKALLAGLMQPAALRASFSSRSWTEWETRVRQILRPRILPGLCEGTWPVPTV